MDIKEILIEAQGRYPPGTSFLSAYSGNDRVVNGRLKIDEMQSGITDCTGNFVYDRGKWAEIIMKYDRGKWAEIIMKPELPIFN